MPGRVFTVHMIARPRYVRTQQKTQAAVHALSSFLLMSLIVRITHQSEAGGPEQQVSEKAAE
jgi:hypothetical protein